MKKISKNGNSIVTYPIMLVFCMFLVIFIGIFFVNTISPIIWYEKLNSIVYKYQFIIEKYGYLTQGEKQNLIYELKNKGFIVENIEINAPSVKKSYGELVEFSIKYKCPKNSIGYSNGKVSNKKEYINIKVTKASYSKN